MHCSRGLAALVLPFTLVTVTTCVFPTEHDAAVHVSIRPLRILLRGSDSTAKATAWQIVAPGDSQKLLNVAFVWTSSNASVATVNQAGHIVGVNSGTAIIRAAARNFDAGALPGVDTLRVSAPLEVDSVRPKLVRYGERVTIYGVGVDSIFSASLAGASLIHVPFSDTVFHVGTARTRYWVPPPATTDSLFFLGFSGGQGVFGFVHGDTTHVIERDIYEPDDTVPAAVDLDAARPFPNTILDSLLFFNPALAFEALKRDEKTGADWYHFTQAASRNATIVLTAPDVAGTFLTFLTDSLGWDGTNKRYFIGKNSWTFGPKAHACHGLNFAPAEAVGDSTIVAFKNLPAGALDAIAIYTQPGRYGLGVVAGYVSELPADSHEDDNSCNAADKHPDALPLRDTLAIENPHDVDWFRFTVPSLGVVNMRAAVLTSVQPDSLKDLDGYIIRVPSSSDTALTIVGADTAVSSSVSIVTAPLAAGDYYAVIVDFAGTSTPYEICLTLTTACAPFPSPPATAGARRQRLTSRRAPTAAFTRAPRHDD
ncbi:MAG TPA: Ig-like domain-containing protein [Gemmatimonadales bacterium]|nr:Ig-like domain-containing protein [Gemmatimonadales bacterium]